MNYLIFPKINPVIFSLGSVSLHWYGLMYFVGFIVSKSILLTHINFFGCYWQEKQKDMESLLYLSFVSLLIGGRVGYIIFYHPLVFFENVLYVFKIWEGGMSFHGGLIGVTVAWVIFSFCKKYHFFQISDFIVPVVPIGLAAGRLGNFINGELYGRVAVNVPWAMLFPNTQEQDMIYLLDHPELTFLFDYYGALPRHPSQLYEMLLEGVLLFVILNFFVYRSLPLGGVSGLFLLFYGLFRIFSECFREPDGHIGLFIGWISMGQILSIPMFIIGLIVVAISFRVFRKKI